MSYGIDFFAIIWLILLFRSYIADATAQRKYEDGKALQSALKEIRAEIERVTEKVSG